MANKLEKVINGLECCAFSKHGDKCEQCPYFSGCETEYGAFVELAHDALALIKGQNDQIIMLEHGLMKLKAQEPIEARLHLCESCTKEYPECDATTDGIEFGSEIGNDNIIGCTAYVNRWKAQEPRVMKVGEVRSWVNSDRVTREPVVIEIRGGVCAWIVDDEVREVPGEADLSSDLYGKTWRCWTYRPSDEVMGATPWA